MHLRDSPTYNICESDFSSCSNRFQILGTDFKLKLKFNFIDLLMTEKSPCINILVVLLSTTTNF